jgi:hypothetical protein
MCILTAMAVTSVVIDDIEYFIPELKASLQFFA